MKDIRIFADGVYIGRADSAQVKHEVRTLTGSNGVAEQQVGKGVTLQFTGVEYTNTVELRAFPPQRPTPPWVEKDQSYAPWKSNPVSTTTKEPIMKASHLAALLAQGFTTVHVQYNEREIKNYVYKAPLGVKVGDKVVVDSTRNGLTVASVVLVDDTPKIDVTAEFNYKWIVSVVDMSAYHAQIAKEAEFLAALEQVEQAKTREESLRSYRALLPEGSEARELFETAVSNFNGGNLLAAA